MLGAPRDEMIEAPAGIFMIFDFDPTLISDLSDDDLRALVARLCEAERCANGGHIAEVLWGGAQTAPDGGLDVAIRGATLPSGQDLIRLSEVGIQVKKASMGPAKIGPEMQPGGVLRPVISRIAAAGGAYVIVSGSDNCADEKLTQRLDAMKAAAADDPNTKKLHLDFFDRNRLARWLSAHPPVAVWARRVLGAPTLHGWLPFGRWTSTPGGVEDGFIAKRGLQIRIGASGSIDDINKSLYALRRLISTEGSVVRLVGLSGVGKSRLVQALFEDTGEGTPLDRTRAIYADTGGELDPPPVQMLEALVAAAYKAILVIDNCPPDLHRRLADVVTRTGGRARLVTVEHDVRDDLPESTEVVRVEMHGEDIAAALVRRRYPALSPDAHRVAALAAGNTRLALALAESAPKTGSLSGFRDEQLFERLFQQRQPNEPDLLRAAQTLALVYSFDASGEEKPDELRFLASVSGLEQGLLYEASMRLIDRGLAQERGRWRAILPHALANRLARDALRRTPPLRLADAFAAEGASRLRLSFARRLAFLHDLDEARAVVRRWTEAGGPLSGSSASKAERLRLLERVCILAPDETLEIVDEHLRSWGDDRPDGTDARLLQSALQKVAHGEAHFDAAVDLLATLALKTNTRDRQGEAHAGLIQIFSLLHSGTTARTGQRAAAVGGRFLGSNDAAKRSLGVEMLQQALQGGRWSGIILSEEESRPDADGWCPTYPEAMTWFRTFIEMACRHAVSGDAEVRRGARGALASAFRDLWRHADLREPLEAAAASIHGVDPWFEGHRKVRLTIRFDTGERDPEDRLELARLRRLESALAPRDLLERIRAALRAGWSREAVVSVDRAGAEDADAIEAETREYAAAIDRLGEAMASTPELLDEIGREIFEAEGDAPRLIGKALAVYADDRCDMWRRVSAAYLSAPDRPAWLGAFAGFLEGVWSVDPALGTEIEIEAVGEPGLRRIYAFLTGRRALASEDVDRALNALSVSEVNVALFDRIVWCETAAMADDDRVRLLRALLGHRGGARVVIDALGMLHFDERSRRRRWPGALREAGADAVSDVVRTTPRRCAPRTAAPAPLRWMRRLRAAGAAARTSRSAEDAPPSSPKGDSSKMRRQRQFYLVATGICKRKAKMSPASRVEVSP